MGHIVIGSLAWSSVTCVLLYAAYLVINKEISATDITYFVFTLIQFIVNFLNFGNAVTEIMRLRGAAASVLEIIERTP